MWPVQIYLAVIREFSGPINLSQLVLPVHFNYYIKTKDPVHGCLCVMCILPFVPAAMCSGM